MNIETTVLLVDDHALYREGLRELVMKWDGFTVIGEAEDGREAVERCRELKPDMVLMDVKMPIMDGIAACATVRRELPRTIVVMLSLYAETERVLAAINAGANGYLLKSIYASELREKLRSVMQGHSVVSDEVATVCFDALRRNNFSPAALDTDMKRKLDSLTPHEKELLRLVALGSSNKEIGERLFIGESTVKKQLSSVTVKLGLKNRVQAATFALRSGLTD